MPPARLTHRLEHVLLLVDDYLHPLFGAPPDPRSGRASFATLKPTLGDPIVEGFEADGRSPIARRLLTQYRGSKAALESYDDNIKRHLDAINARRPQNEQITLKYFQHLALLYTEHLLDRLYTHADAFVADLNQLVEKRNARESNKARHLTPFTRDDLAKLAYWMATGSGKTILLHINYHQILHYAYLNAPPTAPFPFQNILLITPNAGLSKQHLDELRLSGIDAQPFGEGSGNPAPGTVQIIEITKFTEKSSGKLTVNVDSFGDRNLLFVDEGHRGASGDVWITHRNKLAAQGFTFEYSATFGEAFNKGSTRKDIATRLSYGKSIVFDYRYRYFHADGYGKDYTVFNLPAGYEESQADTLLLANLLSLYEQTLAWTTHAGQMRRYNVERPLLMFVGHTVQAGKSASSLNAEDERSLSDVLNIARLLHRVAHEKTWAVATIQAILDGASGLVDDDSGADCLATRLRSLRGTGRSAAELYAGLLAAVFNAPSGGALHMAKLRDAPGEIALRIGDSSTPFGVINIGDSDAFLNRIRDLQKPIQAALPLKTDSGAQGDEAGTGAKAGKAKAARSAPAPAAPPPVDPALSAIVVDPEDAFRDSLFEEINSAGSTVTMLLGAKKFTEGWSSWRVSAMGLLNVGSSEGSEVIQMFGRGVRLLGRERSLKRSAALGGEHPAHLALLETLNIFSINGGYLTEFRNALGREGIVDDFEEFQLPIRFPTWEQEQPKLFIPRLDDGQSFAQQPAFALRPERHTRIKPTIDLRSHVQVESSLPATGTPLQVASSAALLPAAPLALLDWDAIHLGMLKWRRSKGYTNLVIALPALRAIIEPVLDGGAHCHPYFALYADATLTAWDGYGGLKRLQNVVLTVLKKYAERFYNQRRQEWEGKALAYRLLDQSDPNLEPARLSLHEDRPGYVIKVDRSQTELVEAVRTLIEDGAALYAADQSDFPSIVFDRHLYVPLIAEGVVHQGALTPLDGIRSVPVALNKGEALFVDGLRRYLRTNGAELKGRSLYLLRNQSRERGVSFFTEGAFYPDFLLWLVEPPAPGAPADEPRRQQLVFIDPKGLARIGDFNHPKIELFHKLRKLAQDLDNPLVTLDSYIISASEYDMTAEAFTLYNPPPRRDEFLEHHILFPDDAPRILIEQLCAAEGARQSGA